MESFSLIGLIKSLFTYFKPLKNAWRKIRNLEKIEHLEQRVNDLEKGHAELRGGIAAKENTLPPDAEFLEKSGAWFSKSTGLHYCTSCRGNGQCTPLQEQEEIWICKVKGCGQFYRKPSSKKYLKHALSDVLSEPPY